MGVEEIENDIACHNSIPGKRQATVAVLIDGEEKMFASISSDKDEDAHRREVARYVAAASNGKRLGRHPYYGR